MRMLTLALLLASAASVPAHAQYGPRGGRDAGQEGASQPVDEARSARFERRAEMQAERRQEQSQPAPDTGRQARWGGGNWRGGQQAQPQVQVPPQPQGNLGQWDGARRWQGRNDVMTTNPPQVRDEPRRDGRRDGDRDGRRDWGNRQGRVQQPWPVPQNDRRRWDGDRDDGRHWDRDRDNDRAGNQGGWHREENGRWERRGDRDHDGDRRDWNRGWQYRDWNRGWRNDRRYDWQHYRNQFHDRYRVPRYYNPYGYRYGYRRFSIGIYLDTLFFGNRYWLEDPWDYRLPPAPYGCRWVRYYDDVLLVDIRSGYVVDVIYDFFW